MSPTQRYATGTPERLLYQARILRQIVHPAIAEVADAQRIDGELRLRYADVDATALADTPMESLTQQLSVFASLAAGLAHAHKAGFAHTNITADHILVTPSSRGVLLGFDKAVDISSVGEPTARADVGDLAEVLESLGSSSVDSLRTHLRHGNRKQGGNAGSIKELNALITRAKSGHLGAAQFAETLHSLLVRQRTNSPDSRKRNGRRPGKGRQIRKALATAFSAFGAVVVALALSVAVVESFERNPTVADDDEPPLTQAPSQDCPSGVVRAVAGSDVCVDEVEIVDSTIRLGDDRYELGDANDQIVLGRWNCRNFTPALLQLPEGKIWVVDRWPDAGGEVETRLVRSVFGASEIKKTESVAGSCDAIEVTTPTQSLLVEPAR